MRYHIPEKLRNSRKMLNHCGKRKYTEKDNIFLVAMVFVIIVLLIVRENLS